MKKIILGTLALITLGAIAPAQAAGFNWTGWYAGVNAGYSWGKSSTDAAFSTFPGGVPIVPPAGSITSASGKLNGAIAGLQGGYNWQNGQWVTGIEADIQWSGQKGSSNYLCALTLGGGPCSPLSTFAPAGIAGTTLSLDQKLQWFGTLRGRLGTTITPTVLLYVTGGLAVGGIKTDGTLTGITGGGAAIAATGSSSTTKAGWTVGAGLEGVISGKWTGKIEYLYVDYGTVNGTFVNAGGGIQANFSSRITDNVLRVGLNYHY